MERTHITEAAPGRTVFLDGVEYLFFSGTSYLGMHRNAAFRKLLSEGTEKYGSVYGSSRASNLQIAIYPEAEEKLARWLGSEACTVLSSGFMAGQLVYHTLLAAGYQLHYAPGSHPALLGGGGPPPQTSWNEWLENLLPGLETAEGRQAILACSVDPLRSQKYDFSFAGRLPRGKEVLLVIDDSHGFGILGEKGEGIARLLPQGKQVEVIILGSLGKAMGIPAGAVWSTESRARALRQTAFFISASPPAPAGLYAFSHAGDLYREAGKQLAKNITCFSRLIKGLKQVRQAPGLPVFFLEDQAVAACLEERHILASSFRYPTFHSEPLSRIVLSSLHTTADLERLADVLKDYFSD
ncbi:7-keto-8-aminopelargonate synthetase-like enzyme [Anseongella ginsenosidimutans]|uniref:7-keto-8-aminopelargonate synthetase-like enzyme n=1 Tax=Anseongella ginsenosidimutans TaxID=496056 RepID=A0A4R3KVV1_9SPHI|nr:aminotransferase class I/II-fold pyridoxal phosphate-dependent enzyme [Anseongella ginsenosidimutans]QEC51444.1 aminotransferase class I/II-fold pyridoxal phosphate-dependent enzyme [Anseongella ginsenosidimutans]TCS89849.1 7-keto-8-aminopelargonate synthetase-like enzyme [Anseongella ginsenosidimutans]